MSVDIDDWGQVLFRCTFGGVGLDVLAASDSDGRVLARHSYPHRDGVDLEDEGRIARITHARIIFTGDEHRHDFAIFLEKVNTIEAQRFVHPITGTYFAKVGQLESSISPDMRNTILVDCTFEEDSTTPTVFSPAAGTPVIAGVEDVTDAANEVTAAIAATPGAKLADTSLVTDAIATVLSWADTAQAATGAVQAAIGTVNLQLEALSQRIDDEMTAFNVATDIKRYSILAGFTRLGYSIRNVQRAFGERTPQIIEVKANDDLPLVAIATQIYGARDAFDRADQMRRLNDILNPLRIEKGTVLRAQSPTAPGGTLRSPT